MNSDKLNSWLALGANFGVLIGLTVLIFELNQNTEIMRAQMINSRVESQAFRRASTYQNDLLRIRAKLEDEGRGMLLSEDTYSELTAYERVVLREFYAVWVVTSGNTFYQCSEGYLDEESCDALRRTLVQNIIPGMKVTGRDLRSERSSFIAEVRRLSQEAGLTVIGEDGRWD